MLEIRSPFTSEDLKKAYRRKALYFHPDRPGGGKEKFQKLQIAKEVAEYHLNNSGHPRGNGTAYCLLVTRILC